MISCVMPTGGRPELAQASMEDFLRQRVYGEDMELVILDDEDNPSFFKPVRRWGVRYHRLAEPETLGQKRNLINELTSGDLIIHWDDDDMHSLDDVATRLKLYRSNDVDIAGYNSIYFYSQSPDRWWWYESRRPDYAVGTSLIYSRDYWEAHPFRNQKRKSDTAFVMDHGPRVIGVAGDKRIIATIHGENLNDRPLERIKTWSNWHEVKCPLDDSQTEALSKRFRERSTLTAA
jgi:glycosyltransferase involved in cell wall biosynthesis